MAMHARAYLNICTRAGKETFWLTLFHSNPSPDQMTDEISFQAPVLLASVAQWREESALVCLHPEVIRTHLEGLYLENDRVVVDFMEDWNMFWRPLNQALAALAES
jgi:hypothetical protein